MFEVKIDGLDQLFKKFDTFSKQIEALQQTMPQELDPVAASTQRPLISMGGPPRGAAMGASEAVAVAVAVADVDCCCGSSFTPRRSTKLQPASVVAAQTVKHVAMR